MNFIRINLLLTAFLLSGLCLNAQKVDTMEINGRAYFVYPFKISVDVHGDYFAAIDMDELVDFSFRTYKKEIRDQFGEEFSKKEFKQMMRSFDPKRFDQGSDRKYINRKYIKAVRKNPYPLLEQSYTLNQDLVPSLDPIPDGEYVQLFEDFCLADKKGGCQNTEPRIAAYFTIQNNLLEGEAYWLNMRGDTLKYGSFEGGVKTGEWVLIERELPYSLNKKQATAYIENGFPIADTNIVLCTFSNGAKNGMYKEYSSSEFPVEEGFYSDDQRSGEWIYRDIQYKGIGNNRKRIRRNEQITLRYTHRDKDDTVVSKHPWIRNGLLDAYDANNIEFNFLSKYDPVAPPRDLYEVNFSKNPDLDLEEESFGSYAIDSYGEEDYYGEDSEYYGEYLSDYEYDYGYYSPEVFDANRKEYFPRSYVIDSIGSIANYKGTYEAFYPNGQLIYRYILKEGRLVSEDTIFWDNGKAHDVIAFDTDSNHFVRSVYDYDGKLFKELIYDSLGEFERLGYYHDDRIIAYLDGLKAVKSNYGSFYSYDVYDTLAFELNEPLVLFRSWHDKDSSRLYNTEYDPAERHVTGQGYAVTGKLHSGYSRTFSEEFNSWTGIDSSSFGDLLLVVTSSGSLYEGDYYQDSIPQRNVTNAYNRFEVADDFVLYKDQVEYTGQVEIRMNKRKLKLSSKGLKLDLPKYRSSDYKKINKQIAKYKNKGKISNPLLLNYINPSDGNIDLGSEIYYDLFNGILSEYFYYAEGVDDYDYGYAPDKSYPRMESLKGYMLNGKPHGVWTAYDQFGKIIIEVPFEKGEVHGTVKSFNYAYPKEEDEYYDYYQYEVEALQDSLPTKKTYYLSSVMEYKNGLPDGKEIRYNWLKQIERESNYKEGMKHGISIERNNLAFTRINYQDGMIDGYMQTFLTLPGKDSILLYDLNFQNGLLQGESKSYHMNGQLSKRGFFLDGEPIEDYEAYDSLGFKYHYVKFKFGYPVEEKIWEENELSVRYLFDWQDSIYFEPSDITTSQSLERLLYDLGFGSEYLSRPYYGRPTLVNKNGVKYHMTKYFPNDTVARDGMLDDGKKVGCWKFYDYNGEFLYEVNYFDSILVLNDSVRFHSKGVLSEIDSAGNVLYESYIIEKFEKYDCSHTDHYEIRQLYTIWQVDDSLGRMNGYVKNFYDNGVIQSEGQMKDGLPVGIWKIYDPYGKLNQYGQYVLGKRDGRWLSGDLSKTKYLGDICLNPNLPDLEKEIEYRENLLDIVITNYKMGKSLNRQYYDINMNRFKDVEEEEDSSEEENE